MSFPTVATDGRRVMELLGQQWSEGVCLRTIAMRLAQLIESDNETSRSNESTPHQQDISEKPLPWGLIPQDVCQNLFSFLTARDLCCVRASCSGLLESADSHAEPIWKALYHHDFPTDESIDEDGRPWHQRYIKSVISRATQEAGNIRATQRVRESLQTYASKHGGGIVGLICDLGVIPDVRVARAVSHRRRAAMSSAVVANEGVVYDFRCRGLYSGPLNFLPLRTLLPEDAMPLAGSEDLLPFAPETPSPPGFLGYAVRLVNLRPEYAYLRWTALFAVFKDLAVFETSEQAETVRARMPYQRLFYCALDHPGALDDPCPPGGEPLPHIGHWGFRPLATNKRANGSGDGSEIVGMAAEQLEKTAMNARRSLAFLQYGGVERRS